MKISRSLLLSGLVAFGAVQAEGLSVQFSNVLGMPGALVRAIGSFAANTADATASKLYIAALVEEMSNYSSFIDNHQIAVNRMTATVVTAAAFVGLYKLYEELFVEAVDNCSADEYADMFDGFDDADVDADEDNEEVVVETN